MNFDRLRHVSERSELGENREALLAVTIPEQPGSFHKFCKTLGKRGITEFNYRYSSADAAHVYAGIQLSEGLDEKETVIKALKDKGYPVIDMSDNEVAKLHIRYMVGGRVKGLEDEIVYRFQFPERPGALLQFLTNIGKHWNISMFHYRNHGAGYGRVLVGIQVPADERKLIQEYLHKVGYPFWDETDNPAYDLFLNA